MNSEVNHHLCQKLHWNPPENSQEVEDLSAGLMLTRNTFTLHRYSATPCSSCSCAAPWLQVKQSTLHNHRRFKFCLFPGLTLPLWRLATQLLQTDTGAYKVMLSLNMVLSTGQGLLVFSVFILDCDFILAPIKTAGTWVKEKVKGEKENFPVLSAFLFSAWESE